jgi:hypothetical protein
MSKGRYREQISSFEPTIIGVDQYYLYGAPWFSFPYGAYSPQIAKRCWDSTNPGPPYGFGSSPFTLKSVDILGGFVQGLGKHDGYDFGPDFYTKYVGGFIPNGFGPYGISHEIAHDVGLEGNPYGPSYGSAQPLSSAAYNRFKPKIAKAGLGQALAEIRDLLPMLKTSAKGFHEIWKSLGGHQSEFGPKAVAEHFVNHEFGWLPFINDIRQISDVYQNTVKYVRHLRRSNNQWTRRSGTIHDNGEVTDPVEYKDLVGLVLPALPSAYYSDTALANGIRVESTAYRQDRDHAWFVGHFKQYIPELGEEDSNYNKIVNRVHLYGARISPSLIWKVTPWTWAVDWFSNTGDIISNAEDNLFGLVSLGACTMRTVTTRAVNNSIIHLKNEDISCSWSQEITSKTRHGGGPFGFDLEFDDFNPTQLAILSAIGYTRHG